MWSSSALVTAGLLAFAGPHTPAFSEAWSASLQAQWVDRVRPVESQGEGGARGAGEAGRRSMIEIEYAPWMLHWRGHETELPEDPRWIEHRVIPRERLTQIAARYGVTVDQLEMWNRGRLARGLRKGTRLRVLARRIPPPQKLVTYEVGPEESWGDIAHKFRVEPRDLKAWNWSSRALAPGDQLEIWVDPGAPWTVGRSLGTPIAPPPIDPGAISTGRPDRGRLVEGVCLPESPLYTRRAPEVLYGSSYTLGALTQAIASFRYHSGYEGEIVIGAISRRGGGRLRPHRSHQSGRDVDIRLPLLPGVPPPIAGPNRDEVDWHATWGLMQALIDTGAVQYIFLEGPLQRHLYEAARVMGYSHDELRVLIQWPYDYGGTVPVVRHSSGHDHHFHVRFACGPDERRCKAGA